MNEIEQTDTIISDLKKLNLHEKKVKRIAKSINVQFTGLTRYNLRNKIAKAYKALASELGVVKDFQGEGFFYKSQKELTENWFSYIDDLLQRLYNGVCQFVGLPLNNVVSKANVYYNGKIVYEPGTRKPISKADMDKLTKYIRKFLNYNRKAGDKIVTDSQVLGRLLAKISEQSTPDAIKDMALKDFKYKNVTYATLVADEKRIARVFGLDRDAYNQIQLIQQSAATQITGINQRIENDIKSVLIDGIKNNKSKADISQTLFQKLGRINKDWKRIADTEIQNNINTAYVNEAVKSNNGDTTYFMRMEVVDGKTCPFCKRMNGKIAVYSAVPLQSDKVDDDIADFAIWEGKEGTGNVAAMGAFHPHCRGVWIKYEPSKGTVKKSLTWSGHKLQDRRIFQGLKISIENKKGSVRRGTDSDGHKWAIKMNYDYGYIRNTVGVDGDHLDCYIGDNEDAPNVYVIHQKIPGTKTYDEDKCMLGFDTLEDAKKAYMRQYDKAGFYGGVDIIPIEVFRERVVLKKNHNKKITKEDI